MYECNSCDSRVDASTRIKMSLKAVLHITDYMKQEHMFLSKIDVRLSRSRVYMFSH